MSFPAADVTPPVLDDWQYSFGGLTFGSEQPWAVQSSAGLDLPKLNTGDAERPRDTGQFGGLDTISGRDITLTLHAQGAGAAATRTLLNELNAVILPARDGETETPLWFKRAGQEQLVTMARVRQFGLKSDSRVAYSHIVQPMIQFHATDPRFYGATQAASVDVPTPAGGLSLNPLFFPLSFGGGSAAGTIDAFNGGTWEMRPVLVLTGPMLNPSIGNALISGTPTLNFGIQLFTGDKLVIDLDSRSAVLFAAGTETGETRLNTIQTSFWWNLLPGTNVIQFNTKDTSPADGNLQMQWASAYLVGL